MRIPKEHENETTAENSNDSKKKNITLKDWSPEDKPREKLIVKGKKELTTAELLAILLSSGSVGQSAVELAKEILTANNNDLSLLSRQTIGDLTKGFKGIGEAKAVTIIAALELGYRMLREQKEKDEYFGKDSNELFKYISPSLIDLPYEEFWAVYMNIHNKIIFKKRISLGGLTETAVDIRRIFSTALEWNAVSIVVAHNHPTGSIKPSSEDLSLTKMIAEAGNILKIKLRDHLIVGINSLNKPDYFSFYDNGLIQ